MKAIPVDVRQAAVEAYVSERGSGEQIAAEFGISVPSLRRFVRASRRGDGLEPRPHAGGAPRRMQDEEDRVVISFLASHPQATIEDLGIHVARETGTKVSRETLLRTLRRLGIRRQRVSARDVPDEQKPRRYGYGPRHRREKLNIRYTSSLTDAEWDLVHDLFENEGPGRPPAHERRAMVDAICYVVRSGCAWRMLPKDFPKWQAVYAAFRRWASQGRFEVMHDRLRSLWRERIGRSPEPTAALVDSQSVKTAEKGGSSGMMAPRRSRVASATS